MGKTQNNGLQGVMFSLKNSKIVRLAAWPYCTHQRKRQTSRYVSSEMSRRIRKWKNVYHGQRCFLIGSGPSLRTADLKKLQDEQEITFSANRIYHIYTQTEWRPDFYVAFEPEFCRQNADMIAAMEVRKARFLNLSAWSAQRDAKNTFWLNCTSRYSLEKQTTKNIAFSDDIAVCVYDAYSVTYTMLQLAMYMGFAEIYLLGVDHYTKNEKARSGHFYQEKKQEYRTPTFLPGIEAGYRLAAQEAAKRGVRICNATRGGSLDIFERIDFDLLF